jgi:hypothetical protein
MAPVGCLEFSAASLSRISRQHLYGGCARPFSWMAGAALVSMASVAVAILADCWGIALFQTAGST